MRMFIYLSTFVPKSLQRQEEEGIYMHDTLTDTNLNKKLTTLGKKEYTFTLCKDFQYFSLPSW